jgi:UDPglucose--hexose-1-phosphate uridylyltransferase
MIEFRKLIQSSTYLNPFEEFEPRQGEVEIRWDPLTNLTARVVRFPTRRLNRLDLKPAIDSSKASKCPFCEENMDLMTARLDKALFGCERMTRGDVTVIPNLISFDKYSLVAIISQEHYLSMRDLAEKGSLVKGIAALLEAFRCIRENDADARYFSINCNYMPPSGGSLVHPHVQGIAGEWPTNYQRIMIEKSFDFFRANESAYWDALMDEERILLERLIDGAGKIFWFTPFAPKANIDVAWLFSTSSLFSVSEGEWTEFGNGLGKVLAYLDDENIGGFNFSLFSSEEGESHFRANGRIVARRFLPPANAADVNYLEKIHMEHVCLVPPEETARQLRERWQTEY